MSKLLFAIFASIFHFNMFFIAFENMCQNTSSASQLPRFHYKHKMTGGQQISIHIDMFILTKRKILKGVYIVLSLIILRVAEMDLTSDPSLFRHSLGKASTKRHSLKMFKRLLLFLLSVANKILQILCILIWMEMLFKTVLIQYNDHNIPIMLPRLLYMG